MPTSNPRLLSGPHRLAQSAVVLTIALILVQSAALVANVDILAAAAPLLLGVVAGLGTLAGAIALFVGPGPRIQWALPLVTAFALALAPIELGSWTRAMAESGIPPWMPFLLISGVGTPLVGLLWHWRRPRLTEDEYVSHSWLTRIRTWFKHHGEVWLLRPHLCPKGHPSIEVIGRWERSGFPRPHLSTERLSPALESRLDDEGASDGQYALVSVRWKGTRSEPVDVRYMPDPDQSPTERRRNLMNSVVADARRLAAQHAALSRREAGLYS